MGSAFSCVYNWRIVIPSPNYIDCSNSSSRRRLARFLTSMDEERFFSSPWWETCYPRWCKPPFQTPFIVLFTIGPRKLDQVDHIFFLRALTCYRWTQRRQCSASYVGGDLLASFNLSKAISARSLRISQHLLDAPHHSLRSESHLQSAFVLAHLLVPTLPLTQFQSL